MNITGLKIHCWPRVSCSVFLRVLMLLEMKRWWSRSTRILGRILILRGKITGLRHRQWSIISRKRARALRKSRLSMKTISNQEWKPIQVGSPCRRIGSTLQPCWMRAWTALSRLSKSSQNYISIQQFNSIIKNSQNLTVSKNRDPAATAAPKIHSSYQWSNCKRNNNTYRTYPAIRNGHP